jgi:hypothetical protein
LSHCKLVIYNDDFLFLSEEQFVLDEYFDVLELTYLEYGLILNKKKSFISTNGFVFCEIFIGRESDFMNKKESLYRSIILQTLNQPTIVQAKSYFNSTIGNENLLYGELYFPLIIKFWGTEFCKEEVNYPFHLGGWFPKVICGIKVLDYLDNAYALWKASSYIATFNNPKFKNIKGNFQPPICTLNGITISGQNRLGCKSLKETFNERAFKKENLFFILKCQKTLRLRKRYYRFLSKVPPPKFSQLKSIVEESQEDFILPDEYYTLVPKWELELSKDVNPYKVKHPMKAYINALTGGFFRDIESTTFHFEHLNHLNQDPLIYKDHELD